MQSKVMAMSDNFVTATELLFEAIRTTFCLVCGLDMNKSWLLAWLWKPTLRTRYYFQVYVLARLFESKCFPKPKDRR